MTELKYYEMVSIRVDALESWQQVTKYTWRIGLKSGASFYGNPERDLNSVGGCDTVVRLLVIDPAELNQTTPPSTR